MATTGSKRPQLLVKRPYSTAGGERRTQQVGRVVWRTEKVGVLYLHMFPGDFPVFLKQEQDPAAERLLFSVTKAKPNRSAKPGEKSVFYCDVGTLIVHRDAAKESVLYLHMFDDAFQVTQREAAPEAAAADAAAAA